MQRVCFRLQVKADRLDEYKLRHRTVWPDMLRALHDAGWHNYSLFLADGGELVGYFETPSLDEAQRAMARTEVNARWQAEMAGFFEQLAGASPDQALTVLEEIFHLEDQLNGVTRVDSADRTAP
jgi:L-rhamnose mutarotase